MTPPVGLMQMSNALVISLDEVLTSQEIKCRNHQQSVNIKRETSLDTYNRFLVIVCFASLR
jgi:hypothetical protein